jgi:hypothetical protein
LGEVLTNPLREKNPMLRNTHKTRCFLWRQNNLEAVYMARMVEERGVQRVRERGYWGDQDVYKRIILRWIFRKLEGVVGTG